MKKLIALLILLITPLAYAAANDIRISDCEGHVLDINADGTLNASTTIEVSTCTDGGAPDHRLSDEDDHVLNINSDGSITIVEGSPS